MSNKNGFPKQPVRARTASAGANGMSAGANASPNRASSGQGKASAAAILLWEDTKRDLASWNYQCEEVIVAGELNLIRAITPLGNNAMIYVDKLLPSGVLSYQAVSENLIPHALIEAANEYRGNLTGIVVQYHREMYLNTGLKELYCSARSPVDLGVKIYPLISLAEIKQDSEQTFLNTDDVAGRLRNHFIDHYDRVVDPLMDFANDFRDTTVTYLKTLDDGCADNVELLRILSDKLLRLNASSSEALKIRQEISRREELLGLSYSQAQQLQAMLAQMQGHHLKLQALQTEFKNIQQKAFF